ncbi:MAG: sulfite exporter TauE/SafE [Rickettsiales bacterium]|jgi:sulfite exporter TauE/SafE
MNYQEITIIGSLFIFGLFGGFSHCAGMCGPFVLAQVGNRLGKIDIKDATTFKKMSGISLLPYHLGRITSYCFIAVISSFLTNNLKNILAFKQLAGILLIMGALMIFNSAIAKIKLPFRIPARLEIKTPFFIKNLTKSLFLNPVGFKNYLLGIILGFIPCGLVYGAIIIALSLDNSALVLMAMFAFGVGTIPALLITALGGHYFFSGLFNGNPKYLKYFTKIILFINIITLLVMAFSLIFNRI